MVHLSDAIGECQHGDNVPALSKYFRAISPHRIRVVGIWEDMPPENGDGFA